MSNFWLKVGLELARLLVPVVIGVLLFRKFVSPSMNESLELILKAEGTITNLAKLAGTKSQEYAASKALGKSISRDIIADRIPELEALKFILSPDTWEEVEDTIENNPEAILQLYDKYKHLIPGALEETAEKEFDF